MKRLKKSHFLPDLRAIRKLFDEHKREFSDDIIRETAKGDAEKNLPHPQSTEPSPYELRLQHAAITLAHRVSSLFRASLEGLDAQIKAEQKLLERKHNDELQSIQDEYDIETTACENQFGLKEAHKQHQVAEERFNEQYSKFGRAPVAYVPHWLYLIFAFLIFIGEIPLNALVFQIFGENQVMTWIMAFIIGLAVPLTAHFIGIKVREHEGRISLGNAFKAFATFSIVTAALYGLSIMRMTYLREFKVELGLTDSLVDSSFLFFWLNMAVFAAAIVIAYLSHDTVPGYQESEHTYHRQKKHVERRERDRVKTLVKLGKKRSQAISSANERYQSGMVQIIQLQGLYDQILKEGQLLEKQCLQRLQQNLAVYTHENYRLRSVEELANRKVDLTLSFPLELSNMREKLVNDETNMESSRDS
ncbi:MAG: hypothetical protein KDD60_11620 [Bdellovibrionales bacterium]|nr:hypothetical protein [Bdellovibrionales bacterium]